MDLTTQLQSALVIEQQTLAQSHVKYTLQNLGFKQVDFADRSKTAVIALEQNKYDLVLCAYDLNKGADGYQLFERLIAEKLIGSATTFVFMSSENNLPLSQSIIELKPDDFLLKPFTSKELELRLKRVLVKKLALRGVFKAIDSQQFKLALKTLEEVFSANENPRWMPYLMKLRGELLLMCHEWEEAERFFNKVLEVKDYPWASLGLVESLLQQNKLALAEKNLKSMLDSPQHKLAALDLMSQVCEKSHQFEDAMDHLVQASEIAPRNVDRQQQVVNLARLTHDYETQYNASNTIVRNLRHSIHETPEAYLSAIRSAIDYGLTTLDNDEVNKLADNSEVMLSNIKTLFPGVPLTEQIQVAQARLHNMKNEKEAAKKLIQGNVDEKGIYFIDDLEDALDKAKAFHELGFHKDSEKLFEQIAEACREHEQSEVFSEYIKSEKLLRVEIKDSPKDLNNKAVGFFSRGDVHGAFNAFNSAFKLMPQNASIALNLMQTIIETKGKKIRIKDSDKLVKRCAKVLQRSKLTDEQQARYVRLQNILKNEGASATG